MIEKVERKEGEIHTWKTTLAGNGGMYGWKELDKDGGLVQQSTEMYASEADAEKAIRTIAPSSDIVEVMNVKNINPEANTNVNLVKPEAVKDQFAGMNLVSKSVEDKSSDEEKPERAVGAPKEPKAPEVHPNVAKMEETKSADEKKAAKLSKSKKK
jgi:uncharacterized protein YegP (UPF0339 family)